MENNNRYYSRKIDLTELLRNDPKIDKKKFDLTGLSDKPVTVKETCENAEKHTGENERRSIAIEHCRRYLSPKEYAAIVSMIIASVYLLLISFFPLIYNFTYSFEPLDFLKNLLYFTAGIGTISGVFYFIQKETYLQHIADEIFDRVIYQRLEPVLKDVAEVQTGINDVEDKIEMVNINLETLTNKKLHTSEAIPYQTSYYIKYVILINITLAVFLFMLQYPFGYIPYSVTVLFIIWWTTITSEYNLWKVEIAWTWVFFPIIVLPIYTIIMNAYLQDYQLFGSLSIGLCIYIIAYYSWCNYIVKGVLPLDLQNSLKKIPDKNHIEIKSPVKIRYPRFNFIAKSLSRNAIGMGFILISIALFGITWFGYAIQHDLIPEMNWETIGLQGFVWSSSYTYFINIMGIFLIFIGFKMLRTVKT